jgi:HAD superfamily hydrolase (TIGR01549 family)
VPSLVVFFDIGGTLVDSPDIFEIITRKLVGRWPDKQTYDLVLKTYERMIDAIRNKEAQHPFKSVRDIHAAALTLLARQYGYADISGQARDISVDAYGRQSNLFPETKPVLDTLLKNSVRMIIASDNDLDILEIQMLKHDLNTYFVDHCISETAKAYKPTHRFLSNLKKYICDDPNDCYFVGDSWVDVESGRRLGVKSVLIDRGSAGSNTKADYVIRDLNGLIPLLGLE